jgi:hypothetical protein
MSIGLKRINYNILERKKACLFQLDIYQDMHRIQGRDFSKLGTGETCLLKIDY